MRDTSTAFVTTTIHVPTFFDSYAEDAKRYKHTPVFIVIGDKKTPNETAVYCADLAARTGFRVEYFSIERQEDYLKKFPALRDHLPYNSVERRNVGIVYAYELGCETIIAIDDDNLRKSDDFLGGHDLAQARECDIVSSSTGWINVCKLIEEKHGRTFHHRGFPLEMRYEDEVWTLEKRSIRPVVNAGLWLGDPDIDALTRLHHHTKPIEAISHARERNIAAAHDTWTPFNSQNTAVRHDAIPAYFLSPTAQRFSDIWGAYCLKHIADHLGDHVAFGMPLVTQERNPHNSWRDFDNERYGLALNVRFVDALKRVSLTGADYLSCYAELAEKLPNAFLPEVKTADDERAFLDKYFEGMRVWRDTFASLTH